MRAARDSDAAMRLVNHTSALVHGIYQYEKVDDLMQWHDAVKCSEISNFKNISNVLLYRSQTIGIIIFIFGLRLMVENWPQLYRPQVVDRSTHHQSP
jgi:hypothetical protein